MPQYYLNYVGGGVYSVPVFEAEAKRVGVSRGLPARIIKTLKFGDKILLAQWKPNHAEQERLKPVAQSEGGKYFRVGSAEVFGYFIVRGLNFRCEDPEMVVGLVGLLHIEMMVECNETVERMCGTGVIGVRYYVSDSVEDIIRKAQTVEKEISRGAKFKFFVTGEYHKMDKVEIASAKFSRGVVKVEVSEPLADAANDRAAEVALLKDYSRRMYVAKDERERAEREAGG